MRLRYRLSAVLVALTLLPTLMLGFSPWPLAAGAWLASLAGIIMIMKDEAGVADAAFVVDGPMLYPFSVNVACGDQEAMQAGRQGSVPHPLQASSPRSRVEQPIDGDAREPVAYRSEVLQSAYDLPSRSEYEHAA